MDITKEVPVTAIDTNYDPETGKLLLFQGDENGEICVYDITPIIERVPGMVPTDITVNNLKRNPHREFPIEREERKRTKNRNAANDSDSDLDERKIERDVPYVDSEESGIVTIMKKTRIHNELVTSIQYISCTDKPIIMTGSTDRLVHIIDLTTKTICGTLKQGYKAKANYEWDFPV